MKIYLSKKFLEKEINKKLEKFYLTEIEKIRIKKNTKNKVREIYIYLKNNKSIFINGLNNFEKFTDKLLTLVSEKTIIKYQREPIDFDSLFFYPTLGLILSFGTVYLLKLLTTFSYQTMQIFLYLSIIYVLLMVIYFVISKPISKRY